MEQSRLCSGAYQQRPETRCVWLVAFALLSGSLQIGCGDAEKQPAEKQQQLEGQQGQLKGGPPRPKKIKKRSQPRDNPRPAKPRGIVISPLPEDEFTIVGNVDEFSIPHQPPQPDGDVIAKTPDAGRNSTDFDVVEHEKTGQGNSSHLRANLPAGFESIPDAEVSADGLPLRISCVKDGAVMALIPAGLAICGLTGGPPETGPEHSVHLDAYYIDLHEITIGQYEAYRGDLRARKKTVPPPLGEDGGFEQPVTGLRWGEALQYARWSRKSLPTEAEWEKAARGPSGFTFPWGNGKPIWHVPRVPGQIDPVEMFRGDRSPYGVMDLAGNAREWCQDWYSATAYEDEIAKAGTTTLRSPQGPRAAVGSKDRTVHVVKGSTEGWEAWRRIGVPMGQRTPDVGFRCVLRVLSKKRTKKSVTDRKGF